MQTEHIIVIIIIIIVIALIYKDMSKQSEHYTVRDANPNELSSLNNVMNNIINLYGDLNSINEFVNNSIRQIENIYTEASNSMKSAINKNNDINITKIPKDINLKTIQNNKKIIDDAKVKINKAVGILDYTENMLKQFTPTSIKDFDYFNQSITGVFGLFQRINLVRTNIKNHNSTYDNKFPKINNIITNINNIITKWKPSANDRKNITLLEY
jgi:hypothetical protein